MLVTKLSRHPQICQISDGLETWETQHKILERLPERILHSQIITSTAIQFTPSTDMSSIQCIFSLFECVVVVDAQQAVAMYVCGVQLYLRNKVPDINRQLADLVAVRFLFARSSYSSCGLFPTTQSLLLLRSPPQVLLAIHY